MSFTVCQTFTLIVTMTIEWLLTFRAHKMLQKKRTRNITLKGGNEKEGETKKKVKEGNKRREGRK